MKTAAVFSCPAASREPDKESLILAQLDMALAGLAELDRKVLPPAGSRVPALPPGLRRMRPRDTVLALGCAAHKHLADVEKRTLIAGDLALDATESWISAEDIERLAWACLNTSVMVALGLAAWRSIQLLPVSNRRFHCLPPLRIATGRKPVEPLAALVVDHRPEGAPPTALVAALEASGMQVRVAGRGAAGAWTDASAIHVHVGDHTLDANEPRLVDSWHSDRLAIQLTPDRGPRKSTGADVLTIEDEVNGFICATPGAVAALCRELRDDDVLRRKLINAGRSTVAPLAASWVAVAQDMLA